MSYIKCLFSEDEIKILKQSMNEKIQKSNGQTKHFIFQFSQQIKSERKQSQDSEKVIVQIGYAITFSKMLDQQDLKFVNPIIQIRTKLYLLEQTKAEQIVQSIKFHINNPSIFIQKIYSVSKAKTTKQPVVLAFSEPYIATLQQLIEKKELLSNKLFYLITYSVISFYKLIMVELLNPRSKKLKLSYQINQSNIIITKDLKVKIGNLIISSFRKLNCLICKDSNDDKQITVNLTLRRQIYELIKRMQQKFKINQIQINKNLKQFQINYQEKLKLNQPISLLFDQIAFCSSFLQQKFESSQQLQRLLQMIPIQINNQFKNYIINRQSMLIKGLNTMLNQEAVTERN